MSISTDANLLHQFFEFSAQRCPQALALDSDHGSLSYLELDQAANQLAHLLIESGLQPGQAVGLLLPRSAELYISLLAILKAGCAYVPLDPHAPPERRQYILDDCQALLVLSHSSVHDQSSGQKILLVDQLHSEMAQRSAEPPPSGASPQDLAYLIYTSGTTGRPKGCMIEHSNAVHLVRAEHALYRLNEQDRIFQFASVTFDASVEELWMAWAHGATLVWGDASLVQSAPDFARHMNRLRVSVLSCVPTFLAMVDEDLPGVHTLILGGEACSPALISRWASPSRTLWNTYGPTEATVIATAAVLRPDTPLTIGKPLEGYTIHLLDENLQAVGPGQAGEICIGGPGVARGYLNRPELTAEKFVDSPKFGRIYRSADLGRWNEHGELEYLGRADSQIKLRGYRIELAEIECVLLECPGVQAAAVRLEESRQRLEAYYVSGRGVKPDFEALCQALRARLPAYMVPATLDEITQIPRTLAGKVDRANLPSARRALQLRQEELVQARSQEESMVTQVFCELLSLGSLSVRHDFFLDLGGHSMLAARAVSRLRAFPQFAHLSVGDLYAHPTAEKLARLAAAEAAEPAHPTEVVQTSAFKHFACSLGQGMGLVVLSGLYVWQWLGAYLTYGYLYVMDRWSVSEALLGALAVNVLTTPALLLLCLVAKWSLLGRIRAGEYPLWGWFYLRFWFVRGMLRASPVRYLSGTPWLNLFFRLMGARVGPDVFLGSHALTTFDLFEIGQGSSLGQDSSVEGSCVENGMLRLAPIKIGKHCWVGVRSSLGLNSVMSDGSGLADLSLLADGQCIPEGQRWCGSPAAFQDSLTSMEPRSPWSWPLALLQAGGIVVFPLLVLGAFFPGMMFITKLGHADEGFAFLLSAPLVAVCFVVFLCLEIWALKWLILGKLRPACRPVRSLHYLRVWFFEKVMELSLEVVGTLYTTLFIRPWLISLGGKIGARSEVSTIRFVQPDLVETGEECFFADDVSVGAADVRAGWITHEVTRFGRRSFLGNGCVIPAGTDVGCETLIGTLSRPPQSPVEDGTTWFGSPAQALAAHQKASIANEELTYRPSGGLVLQRLLHECFRIILPSTFFVVLASMIISVTDVLQDYIGHGEWLLLLPFLYMAGGLAATLITAGVKWLLVGRYRSSEHPLWSSFVWRTELVTGVYENFAVLFFLDLLRGTTYLCWALRMLGMKIGHRCYIDSTWFTEFDLIELGDEVCLNDNSNVQTHLFQGRVMTTGPVRVESYATIGSMSTVLYNSRIERGARLGDLSLVMKGESLPAGSCWQGSPSRPTLSTAAGSSLPASSRVSR